MKRFLFIIHKIEDIVLILLVSYIVVSVCINVFLRYFFSSGLLWNDEIIGFLFVFLCVLGYAVVIRDDNGGIFMDIIIQKIPLKKQRYLYVPIQILIALVLVFFIIATIKHSIGNADVNSPMNRIPMLIPYGAMAVGFILMLFELVVSFVNKLKNKALYWETIHYEDNIS